MPHKSVLRFLFLLSPYVPLWRIVLCRHLPTPTHDQQEETMTGTEWRHNQIIFRFDFLDDLLWFKSIATGGDSLPLSSSLVVPLIWLRGWVVFEVVGRRRTRRWLDLNWRTMTGELFLSSFLPPTKFPNHKHREEERETSRRRRKDKKYRNEESLFKEGGIRKRLGNFGGVFKINGRKGQRLRRRSSSWRRRSWSKRARKEY